MSSNHSLSDVASLKSTNPEKADFYLDRKAVKLLHELELARYKVHHINLRLEINQRDFEKYSVYDGPKINQGIWASICRRWEERHEPEKRRKRKIEEMRFMLLFFAIMIQEEEVKKEEKKLAKLTKEFEARVQWKSKEDEADYRRWITEEDRRKEMRREIRRAEKNKEREWQENEIVEAEKTKKSKGFRLTGPLFR
ncbi:hypothetical protein IL306_010614 [Fusarium sp. DS 682]|nr:hypothetical protein IL306_010614 [Fusarium sp. DS 682]